MTEVQKTVAIGDVIQISPESDVNPVFGGKLALVEEVRGWGVVAFVDTFEGKAYIRLRSDQFERIGLAPFLPPDVEEARVAAESSSVVNN